MPINLPLCAPPHTTKNVFNEQHVHCTSKHVPLLSPNCNRQHQSDILLIDTVRDASAWTVCGSCAGPTNRRRGGEHPPDRPLDAEPILEIGPRARTWAYDAGVRHFDRLPARHRLLGHVACDLLLGDLFPDGAIILHPMACNRGPRPSPGSGAYEAKARSNQSGDRTPKLHPVQTLLNHSITRQRDASRL